MKIGKEITKEDVLNLVDGVEFAYYNPLTDTYKFEKANKNDIAHNKYAIKELVFFEALENKGDEETSTL